MARRWRVLVSTAVLLCIALAAFVLLRDDERNPSPHASASSQPARAKKITCPSAPGFTATRAADERAESCAAAERVQHALLDLGAIAANVRVEYVDATGAVMRSRVPEVTAQVFVKPRVLDTWDADSVMQRIAEEAGTSVDHVKVVDETLNPLFSGGKAVSARPNAPTR